MRYIMLIVLFLSANVHAAQGCLYILGTVNGVHCPKCSDPGASGGVAAKRISGSVCVSCAFYCWYTALPGGGEFTFLSNAESAQEPGCKPSDEEIARRVREAIPVAMDIAREDFAKLARESPEAAAAIALLRWRGSDDSLLDARGAQLQFASQPTFEDAMGLYDDFAANVELPHAAALPEGAFIDVQLRGERVDASHVRLAMTLDLVDRGTRTPLSTPPAMDLELLAHEVATMIAGHPIIARHARLGATR